MSAIVTTAELRRSRVRLFIVTMLFLVTTVNYADRATLSIAGPALSKELHLDPVAMGPAVRRGDLAAGDRRRVRRRPEGR